jgi:hypothetical protein
LVYLAIQVRQNTISVRSATLQSNTALWSSLLSDLAEPGVVEAYAVGLSGSKDIKPLQYTQFFLLCRCLFVAFENQYYQFCQGALDRETYAAYERSISQQFLSFSGFRIWWQQSREVFSPAFAVRVDQMIKDTPVVNGDRFLMDWKSFERPDVPSA